MELMFTYRKNDNHTHQVRLLSPLGVYPIKTFIMDDSALFISEDICFSVTPLVTFVDSEFEDEGYYTEMEWASINEIKLYSSIMLSLDRMYGYSVIYPFSTCHYVKMSGDVSNYLSEIKKELIKAIIMPAGVNGWHPFIGQINRGLSLPPVTSDGEKYDLRDQGFDANIQEKVFEKIDVNNFILIRGLSTLLRSRMLLVHGYFMEEAIYSLFISLDASFNMILDKLKEVGISNPTSKDAAMFISKTFNAPETEKYFGEYYEGRIKTFHPKSRFGTYPHAPLTIDDYFFLSEDLSTVYLYLTCGYVSQK